MQKFNYEALDKSGQEQTGEIECADEPDAVNQLRERGLFVTKIGRDGEPGFFEMTLRASTESQSPVAKPVPASSDAEQELIRLTARLLEAIDNRDWKTYSELCDGTLTAFEPEAKGQLIEGLEFHQFYFELRGGSNKHSSICSPHVRVMSGAAVISYTRLVQVSEPTGPRTAMFEETRVWERVGESWRNVHFHRSEPTP